MKTLCPQDHAEAVATFRHGVIGGVCARELPRGELAHALRDLSTQRFRAPDADSTRTYSVPTLERWYYAFVAGGLDALRPHGRTDKGRGRGLSPELRELICDIRLEHPSASAKLIITTLEADGRLEKGTVKAGTLRKLFRQRGLDRIAARDGSGAKTRLRWQASAPDALWHADVCHFRLKKGEKHVPVRIHGMLDDCSRYIVALEAHSQEREEDMLGVFVRALRLHGKCDILYLDNGSTYRGEVLQTACSRLGISLIHAQPYDPQARGKMERFWRTLRQGCLDHLGEIGSLDELNRHLAAFLDRHYHPAAHSGLLGRSPQTVYVPRDRTPVAVSEVSLRAALAVRERRRVHRDTTVSVGGRIFELDHGFLAGKIVEVVYSHLDTPVRPEVEFEGRRYPMHLVDPQANALRKRPPRSPEVDKPRTPVPFDPSRTTATEPDAVTEPDAALEELDHVF